MTQSREIRLKARPVGLPTADNFELASVDLAAPGAGEVQVRNHWMTVDPYMRGRRNDVKSYTPPFALGQAMDGGAVGQVTASNDPALQVGDMVQSNFGWREAFNAPAAAVQKLPSQNLPPQTYLGAAGMPGLTAYAGLLRVAALKEGDVVFVSGHPGGTERAITVSQLIFQRDVGLPWNLIRLAELRGRLDEWMKQSPERTRVGQSKLRSIENALKAPTAW